MNDRWQKVLSIPPELVEAAKPMREMRAPPECTRGAKCWVLQGARAMTPPRTSGRYKCTGCGGWPRS
jgi:hypothetical protein